MSNTPSDEELIAELEAAGAAFMAFRGGIDGTKDKTGWPPGLLQDDCKPLSRWFASKPEARYLVRQVCREIALAQQQQSLN